VRSDDAGPAPRVKVSIDPWDPSYGTSVDSDPLADPTASVNVDVERVAADWAPIAPPAGVAAPPEVVFVDGVRRVEARVWVEPDSVDGDVAPGLCASWAAGAVRYNGGVSRIAAAQVGRGLFTASRHGRDLVTAHGRFTAYISAGTTPEALSLALQERMTAAELEIAADTATTPDALLVVDGPLRGRQHLSGAVGLVKTHHVDYLPADVRGVLRALRAGQRTPVFTIGTTWSRHSWYLRLPGPDGGPMAGIVRIEAAAILSPADTARLADVTATLLPRFASTPHKDPRAPQNLVPIAGLERELRRRLGDPQLLYRALRVAAAA